MHFSSIISAFFLIFSLDLFQDSAIVFGDNVEQLWFERFKQKNYDTRTRPVAKHGDAVNVTVGVDVVKVLDVDEDMGEVSLVMWLLLQWNDPRLKWKSDEFENMTDIVLDADSVWRPDISLYNGIDAFSVKSLKNTELIVQSDGEIYWMPSAHVTVSCGISSSLFPFDRHQCDIHWGSWLYDGYSLDVQRGAIEMEDFEENPQWLVTDIKLTRREVFYKGLEEPYPRIVMTIDMARRSIHYFFGLILPCLIFSFLIVLQFLIPPDIGERVVYGIATLMLLTVFGYYVSGFTPQAWPNVPLIAVYIFCLMIGGAAALLNSCLVVNFYHTKFNMTMRPWVKKIFLNVLPKVLFMKKEADNAVRQMTIRRKSTMKKPMPEVEPLLGRQQSAPEPSTSAGNSATSVAAVVDRNPTFPTLYEILRDIREISHVINLRLAETKGSPEWKYAAEAINRFGLFTITLYLVICHAVMIIQAIASGL